jgi:ATP-dependent Lon protease
MEMQKPIHLTGKDLTDMVQLRPQDVGKWAVIPGPKDRMEVLNLAGYTSEEKLKISKQFLFPRQLEENGITKENLSISDDAMLRIISQYTKEAGVRNLEREIASISRKVARKIAEALRVTLSPEELEALAVKPTENLQPTTCTCEASAMRAARRARTWNSPSRCSRTR